MNSVTHTARSTTATILGTFGMFIIVSFALIPMLNLISAGFLQVFALPGRFLFASFHAAAIFVPMYLFAAAALLRRRSDAASVLALNLSILPFLTAAVALRLAFDARIAASPVTSSVVDLLGRTQGIAVFSLLTAMLAGLVFVVRRLWRTLDRDSRDKAASQQNADAQNDVDLPVLELPPPAAAFAWHATPRGRARAERRAREREEQVAPSPETGRGEAEEAAPSPGDGGAGTAESDARYAETAGFDLEDDLPQVIYPRHGDAAPRDEGRSAEWNHPPYTRASRGGVNPRNASGDAAGDGEGFGDGAHAGNRAHNGRSGDVSSGRSRDGARTRADDSDDGTGLQIAWPNGRSRVTFDDVDSSGNSYDDLEMLEPVDEEDSDEHAAAGRGLVVEFRNGHFRSIDAETEISLGFNPLVTEQGQGDADRDDSHEVIARETGAENFATAEEYQSAGNMHGYDADEADYDANEAAYDPDEADYDPDEAAYDPYEDDYDFDDVDDAAADLEASGFPYDYESDDDEADEQAVPRFDAIEESEELEAVQGDDDTDTSDANGGANTASAQPISPSPTRRKPKRGRTRGNVSRYKVPVEGLLKEYPNERYWELDERTKSDGETLRYTLQEFGIEAEVTGIRKGPVITMFEILPAPGVKLTKIVNLADNIALRLAAQTVRIVAPIPGKHAVGIEVPNKRRAIVSFADLVQQSGFKDKDHSIPLAIGKDIPGDAQIIDLAKTPHLLIAGATGSGKSVCVNSIICSILYRRAPQDVKMILIDPKIVELKFYNDIPHLLTPVITEPKRAFQALQWALYEMERRYSLLDSLQVRDIASYNRKVKAQKLATETLPYLVIVVDEFADLMATSGKELESTLARLAAMSRAVGIHLVLATQRPSTDVITGLIKANIPSRIAFMVASKVDSRIILDTQGAEKLLGRGDMLFTSAWDPAPIRMQGAFLSEDEVERVVTHVKSLGEPDYIDDEIFIDEDEDSDPQEDLEDPLLEKAISVVQQSRKASASYLQRRLKVGYNRAARMVEEMERHGIVGPSNGSKPREILRNEAVGVGE